jgi:hypothetical protein
MKTPTHVLVAFAVSLVIAGCGKKEEAPAFKDPLTVEQAATALDLSKFLLVDGAKPVWPRGVASLSYEGPGDVKSVFEFQRGKLAELGWKELPNSSMFMPAEVKLSAIGVELQARK